MENLQKAVSSEGESAMSSEYCSVGVISVRVLKIGHPSSVFLNFDIRC